MSAARADGNQREYGKPIVENNNASPGPKSASLSARQNEIPDGKLPQLPRAFPLPYGGLRYLAIQSSRTRRVWVVATFGQDYSAVTAR
jgi:hypothetical protein